MKKLYFFIILFIGLSYLGFSQQNNNFDNLTSGKWQIESVVIQDEIMNVSEENHWIIFHPNGLYQIMLDKEEQIGTWKLDGKSEIKFDSKKFDGASYIKNLTDSELKFSISEYTLALSK